MINSTTVLRSALLGLLRRGSRRPAQRRPARGASLQRPRHRPDHRRHLLVVRRQERRRPRSRARSRSTPTSSWAAATTSSSACSTTAASANTPTARTTTSTPTAPSRRTATRSCRSRRADDCKSIGVFADDAYQVGRATFNLGLRYDNSKAYFVAQDLLDASGNPTGAQSKAVDDVFNWQRGLATARRQLQGERERLDAAQGALRPLLPWHRHRRVRQHHAVDHAEICVLGTYNAIRSPAGQGAGLRHLQTDGRPELEEPVHRSVHPGLRAAGRCQASGSR